MYCESCVSLEIFILRQCRSRVRTNAIQICCGLIALRFQNIFLLIPQFYTFDLIWFILIVILSNVDIMSQTYFFSVLNHLNAKVGVSLGLNLSRPKVINCSDGESFLLVIVLSSSVLML